MSRPTPREIQNWWPRKWSEVVGNTSLVALWLNYIQNGLCNFLVTGPNRTGKTRITMLGIRSLLCPNRTKTLDPCGQCATCKLVWSEKRSHAGLYSAMVDSNTSFFAFDCENLQQKDLDDFYENSQYETKGTIVYLDELEALRRRGFEKRLLKIIDECEACWIGSAITLKQKKGAKKGEYVERLSKEMKGRFAIKEGTSVPSREDLTRWISDRCKEWEITIRNPEITIPLMVERSQQRVGYVLHMLALGAAKGRDLGPDDIEGFNLDTLD